jgi:hypothetical protein
MAAISKFVASFRNLSDARSVRTIVVDTAADTNTNAFQDSVASAARQQKLLEQQEL